MYLDFHDLKDFTVEEVTTIAKVIDNIIKLENDDVFVCEDNMEYLISELDDVVIFKQTIDKYTYIRMVDSCSRMKSSASVGNNSLLDALEEDIDRIGDSVLEFYKLLINDEVYEVEKNVDYMELERLKS